MRFIGVELFSYLKASLHGPLNFELCASLLPPGSLN